MGCTCFFFKTPKILHIPTSPHPHLRILAITLTFPIHYHLPTHITPGGDDNIDMPDETRAVNADDVDTTSVDARHDDLTFNSSLQIGQQHQMCGCRVLSI